LHRPTIQKICKARRIDGFLFTSLTVHLSATAQMIEPSKCEGHKQWRFSIRPQNENGRNDCGRCHEICLRISRRASGAACASG